MRALKVTLVALVAVATGWLGLAVWSARQWPHASTRRITLRSGREVEVIAVGLISTLSPPVWGFEYRTRTPVRDYELLRAEVAALWPDIESEAETSGVRKAFVKPVNFSRQVRFDGFQPMLVGDTMTAFTFERDGDGTWRMR